MMQRSWYTRRLALDRVERMKQADRRRRAEDRSRMLRGFRGGVRLSFRNRIAFALVWIAPYSWIVLLVILAPLAFWIPRFTDKAVVRVFHFSPSLTITVFCVVVGLIYLWHTVATYRLSGEEDVGRVAAMIGLSPLILLLTCFAAWGLRMLLFPRVLDSADTVIFQVGVLASVLALGGLAYSFKRLSKLYYGVSEVLLSAATTWFLVAKAIPSIHHVSRNAQDWVGIGAAAYLFSRGIGNVAEGFEARRAERRARFAPRAMGSAAVGAGSGPGVESAGADPDSVVVPRQEFR